MHDYLEEPEKITCPYCGETVSVIVDYSAGEQQYYEDCPVCCRSILITIGFDEHGELSQIDARSEDE